MECWKCKQPLLNDEKITFRSTCPKCGSDLHCCRGCKYHSPGKPNECLVPGTDWIRDREALNFCEDFKVIDQVNKKESGGKKKFNSLFKDDIDYHSE